MSSQFKEFWNELTKEYGYLSGKDVAKEAWNSALDKFVTEVTNPPNKSYLSQYQVDTINKMRNDND